MSYKLQKENLNPVVINSILQLLEVKHKSSFGDLVKNIKAPYHEVLKHVLHLKHEGVIDRIKNPEGYYQLLK